MNFKNIHRAVIVAFLFCSFICLPSINENSDFGQYPDYNQSWSHLTLTDGFTGGGGGIFSVSITDNLLTMNINVGFSQNKLKVGNVVQLATSPAIPDMELGFLNLKNGTTVYNSSVKVSIISNYIYFQHTAGHNSQFYTSINGSFQVDLSPEGSGGSSSSTLSKNQNYVYTVTAQDGTLDLSSLSEDKKIESVTYFDGLGRPVQQIGIRQAGGEGFEDIVTHIYYDEFGRQSKGFLPYPEAGINGAYKTSDVLLSTQNFYFTNYTSDFPGLAAPNTNPYSETQFEASPLNRPLKQAAPGSAWRLGGGHEIEYDYQTNALSEVRFYDVSLLFANGIYEPTLVLNSYYNPGELYKTITYDENNNSKAKAHSVEEFKDKHGRVILKRTYMDTTAHDTYYVYDDFGNLTFVLPPKSEPQSAKPDATELRELCYQYKYDARNRLVEKKIPGKGWEYIVYNKLDQPILTQDEVQRNKSPKEWLFTKYDAFGRVIMTGIHTYGTTTTSQSTMQSVVNTYKAWEDKTTTSTNNYYTNLSYPTSNLEVLTLNYYDNYTFDTTSKGLLLASGAKIFGNLITHNVKGLATGSKIKVLDRSPVEWVTTISHYDKKGRVVYTGSYNDLLKTTEKVKMELNFVGMVKKTETYHKRDTDAAVTIIDNFTYDHVNRLVKHTQTLNGKTEVIAVHIYDKLGQLKSKEVGSEEGSSRLQTVDYNYNIRGWLTGINNTGGSNSIIGLGTNDLFGFQINYNKPTDLTKALFNGNISQTLWKSKSADQNQRSYLYLYDNLNRLTRAISNDGKFDVGTSTIPVSYDKNGNIMRLYRKGAVVDSPVYSTTSHFNVMDNLTYTYDSGNKLLKVADAASIDKYGFKDDALNTASDLSNDYTYDPNGNMTSDANKGITSITYNHLNLPEAVTISGQTIDYTYDATGAKLKKTFGSTNTEYAGNFIYKDGILEFFSTPEGYVSYDKGQFNYVYNYVDHLGNVRLSYSDANRNGSIDPSTEIIEENNYYPFGLKHQGYNHGISSLGSDAAKKFKYNGQELNETTGLYEMDLRQYNPSIARWISIDPVIHYEYSTYNAFDNNPVFWADPSGANAVYNWDDGKYYDNGKEVSFEEALNSYESNSESDSKDDYIKNKKTGEVHWVDETGEEAIKAGQMMWGIKNVENLGNSFMGTRTNNPIDNAQIYNEIKTYLWNSSLKINQLAGVDIQEEGWNNISFEYLSSMFLGTSFGKSKSNDIAETGFIWTLGGAEAVERALPKGIFSKMAVGGLSIFFDSQSLGVGSDSASRDRADAVYKFKTETIHHLDKKTLFQIQNRAF